MERADYGVGSWDAERWGNHRALVEVSSTGEKARVRIPWRRCDDEAEKKGVFVRRAADDSEIPRVYVHRISREFCEIAFDTAGVIGGGIPGIYEVYYMRGGGNVHSAFPVTSYQAQPLDPDKRWSAETAREWESLPEARLVRIESCGGFHSFYPMEICAAGDETAELMARFAERPFLIFPEHREYPIRMKDDLPLRWVERGAFGDFHGEAERGEFFVLQLGLFRGGGSGGGAGGVGGAGVRKGDKERDEEGPGRVALEFGALRGSGGEIGAERFTCFNLGGTDFRGRAFTKEVFLEPRRVKALWIGIDLADDIRPGEYAGELKVSVDGRAERVSLTLRVADRHARFRGDDRPARHSRLRWLNSTLGMEGPPVGPYTPVRLEGRRFDILGRRIEMGENGLPAGLTSFFNPEVTGIGDEGFALLAAPMRFRLEGARGAEASADGVSGDASEGWIHDSPSLGVTEDGSGTLMQTSRREEVTLEKKVLIEPEGFIEYRCRMEARGDVEGDIELKDTVLEIPLREQAVKYAVGLGMVGGAAPEGFEWRWDTANRNQDTIWLGSERGGLRVLLFDDNYRTPLVNIYYKNDPLNLPVSWDNGGRGCVELIRRGGVCLLRCSGGARRMRAGEVLHFNFRLAVTPFRTLDTEGQWAVRFCHRAGDPAEIRDQGANVINVHHANPMNPYINYPFLRPGELRDYADSVHDLGMKMRVYYTVRELTNHTPEIFALESLDNEIFQDGPGGGHSWLREHVHGGYLPAWYVPEYGCASISNRSESRWENFYIQGLKWLIDEIGIDGVYLDDFILGRNTMKRMRRVLDEYRPGSLIDVHSFSQYDKERAGYASSINLYMEHLPYVNRLWLGEDFQYDRGPDYWMTEAAGIPFGTMSEMLHAGGHLWRGMLYGMTCRLPHESGDPRPVWEVWDMFGMAGSRMLGYWSVNCPVRTGREDVLATVYEKDDSRLIAVGSWCKDEVKELYLEMEGYPGGASGEVSGGETGEAFEGVSERAAGNGRGGAAGAWELYSPGMGGRQDEEVLDPAGPIRVPAEQGRLLILRKKKD